MGRAWRGDWGHFQICHQSHSLERRFSGADAGDESGRGLAAKREAGPYAVLFLKTGVCGGFTTFSTFSLESLRMLEQGQKVPALLYILLSVAGCIAGVWLGEKLT